MSNSGVCKGVGATVQFVSRGDAGLSVSTNTDSVDPHPASVRTEDLLSPRATDGVNWFKGGRTIVGALGCQE